MGSTFGGKHLPRDWKFSSKSFSLLGKYAKMKMAEWLPLKVNPFSINIGKNIIIILTAICKKTPCESVKVKTISMCIQSTAVHVCTNKLMTLNNICNEQHRLRPECLDEQAHLSPRCLRPFLSKHYLYKFLRPLFFNIAVVWICNSRFDSFRSAYIKNRHPSRYLNYHLTSVTTGEGQSYIYNAVDKKGSQG